MDTATGTIAQRIDYDSFGNTLNDTNPAFQPFGFAGGLYDQNLGITRFGARDYDPSIGRWLTKDPIGLATGLNTYEYVDGNPVGFIDPNGQSAILGGSCTVIVAGSGLVSWYRSNSQLGDLLEPLNEQINMVNTEITACDVKDIKRREKLAEMLSKLNAQKRKLVFSYGTENNTAGQVTGHLIGEAGCGLLWLVPSL
ncbi:RHS repeat-associated core domain-containing protein [Shewanella sp. 125m-7]